MRLFTCARCGGTFETTWSDRDAAAEMTRNLVPVDGPVEELCDDCYDAFLVWARRNAPEMLR